VYDLVLAGVGIAALPRHLVEADLAKGSLRQLLPQYKLPTVPVNICFTDRRLMPSRVRLLIDAIVSGLEAKS
jgi:DNA-binding transcriptional LysR family regulator